ncbi:DinB family protein [Pontibacter sp. G13]|uniref:DinB family protein n=1 Tax=Pontibacter sp. G13 TaxID=3074898 RepID=UPI00288B153D|nr:DinB family protein [Pontibacter sp. G13]WNJ16681.1 DinB family protein [Pontibacter sp. G13]
MNSESMIAILLVEETRRRLFDESFPRAKQCLETLSESEIWASPNANTNSVGNLILHLCGNARQWIISGLGGVLDTRTRQVEFDSKGTHSRAELIQMVEDLERDLGPVLAQITPEKLIARHPVQGYEESGVSILVHVVEHFSYHVGQITHIVKALKNVDTGYYAGEDLG